MDKLTLKGVEFYGNHGVFSEENRLGQRFYVDLEMLLNLRKAGQTDNVEDSVNYAEVYEVIKAIVEKQTFKLIETLAEHIASGVLETYTSIHEVTVRVTKPHPPFDIHFEGVAVEITRKREA
ncbi:dihydroneopterin aldolase [Paenibacillus larvae]|uniref:7,8-dihydroneopterin aldolase n=3 Tax=Paenibacillus larvae TaxID=1464 RepID=A0A2L1U8M7_9BACL|nr:dihydroneopterin aldolase [Paenibacillus larvae]AQR78898.1 dihydroneopterin aldolase [Paenibacillus larvae subsp. larvae]AQT85203.1 dihydroneopterin aldolase [Paenibacillus larvae subsp. pulvifaciens]AQZ47206.1 dihydroneopterin aldolase [Paenibacillus larvae subsp. pulvifaciens]ARF68563.1 dihydroneopterin aldolase [Paenibacillus larvae subsp. pulvifaciens]AVF24039.1 dihydroneopterin aldolase FolB [Paenibacillus larvae subsp. larvae]